MLRLALSAIAAMAISAAGVRAEAPLTVFSAASTKTALDAVAAEFTDRHGTEIVPVYAGSSALARQIAAGAPADLFLSANRDWMDWLEARDLILPETRRDLFGNRLALIAGHSVPGGGEPGEIGADLDLQGLLGEGRLAMALVDAVPAGIYGRQALETLGLWDAVSDRLAQADNARSALALVATGAAPLGIVYRSDALAEERVAVLGLFPSDSHAPIVYPAAIVAARDSEAARAFLDHLAAPESRARFAALGFDDLAE